MSLITLYALFGDDIRLVCVGIKFDDIFFGISLATLFFFLVEIGLCSVSQKHYFLSFFFWLDIISTVSLIFDIGWIWDAITGT
jgi:hypothetical protein